MPCTTQPVWVLLSLLLLFLAFPFPLPTKATSRILYVKPTEGNTHCPSTAKACLTLDEYAQNTTEYFVSNTTFEFLPGTHMITQLQLPLQFANISNLALVSANWSHMLIDCEGAGSRVEYLTFHMISNLTLRELNFTASLSSPGSGCGLELENIVNLSVSHVSVRTPMDTALRLKNIWGISTIEHIKANGTIYSSTAVSLEYNDNEPSPYLCNALVLKCSLFESIFVYDQSQILMEITSPNLLILWM